MQKPGRRRVNIRLHDFDYSQPGAYFITICAAGRRCLFGKVVDDEMLPNMLGLLVENEWLRTALLRPEIELDAFAVMPNHFHAIVIIADGRATCLNDSASPQRIRSRQSSAASRLPSAGGHTGCVRRRLAYGSPGSMTMSFATNVASKGFGNILSAIRRAGVWIERTQVQRVTTRLIPGWTISGIVRHDVRRRTADAAVFVIAATMHRGPTGVAQPADMPNTRRATACRGRKARTRPWHDSPWRQT